MKNVTLLLSDSRGVYIPRDFVNGFDLTKWSGINDSDVETCQNPENEWYWDAWISILDNAKFVADDGRVFTLHQDGDLWALCYDSMTDEEKTNFGFEVTV
jgi:hypothetical protein